MRKDGIFDGDTVDKSDPKSPERDARKAKDAMERIFSSKTKLGKLTVRELIDEGRRY